MKLSISVAIASMPVPGVASVPVQYCIGAPQLSYLLYRIFRSVDTTRLGAHCALRDTTQVRYNSRLSLLWPLLPWTHYLALTFPRRRRCRLTPDPCLPGEGFFAPYPCHSLVC